MKSVLLALALVVAGWAPVHAADAAHPYSNVNRANDAGNDTGDSRVDSLNQAQLKGGAANVTPAVPYAYAAPYPYPYGYYAPPAYYPVPYFYRPRPYVYYRW